MLRAPSPSSDFSVSVVGPGLCVCVCVCEALQNKGTVYCAYLLKKVNNKDIENLGHTVLLYFVQIIIDTRPNEYVSSCMSFSVI